MSRKWVVLGFLVALFSSISRAKPCFYEALNGETAEARAASLATAYRGWLDVAAPTEHELAALLENPLVLPAIEGGRTEVRAVLAEIATLHRGLSAAERTKWLETMQALVREKGSERGHVDREREKEKLVERPGRALAWFESDLLGREARLLPGGRVLAKQYVFTIRDGIPEPLRLAGEGFFPHPFANAVYAGSSNLWIDLTTGTEAAKSPLHPAKLPADWKLEQLLFTPDGNTALLQKGPQAYVYDWKTPGAKPVELAGMRVPLVYAPENGVVLGVAHTTLGGGVVRKELVLSTAQSPEPKRVILPFDVSVGGALAPDGKHFFALVEKENRLAPDTSLVKIDAATGVIVAQKNLENLGYGSVYKLSPDGKTWVRIHRRAVDNGFDAVVYSTEKFSPMAAARFRLKRPDEILFDARSERIGFSFDQERRIFPRVLIYDFAQWIRSGILAEP